MLFVNIIANVQFIEVSDKNMDKFIISGASFVYDEAGDATRPQSYCTDA